MKNIVVVGSQWGDEGKGKIVDWLSEQADVVIRFQGGHNAGHTLVIDGVTYKVKIVEIIIPPKIVAPTANLEPSPAPGPIFPITSGSIAIMVLKEVIMIGLNLILQASLTADSIFFPAVLIWLA